MRKINEEGINFIKHFEGLRTTPYLCPARYLTIGYGHVIKKSESFLNGITAEAAEELLKKDISDAELAVLRLIHANLNDNQFNALVDFVYNVGSAALQRSTLRMKINRGEQSGISREFMRWVWGRGRRIKGLTDRRRAESIMYLS